MIKYPKASECSTCVSEHSGIGADQRNSTVAFIRHSSDEESCVVDNTERKWIIHAGCCCCDMEATKCRCFAAFSGNVAEPELGTAQRSLLYPPLPRPRAHGTVTKEHLSVMCTWSTLEHLMSFRIGHLSIRFRTISMLPRQIRLFQN